MAHSLLRDEGQILAVERFIHGAYVFLPAINLLFFHHVLGITRPALTWATLVISLLLALTVPTRWYFTGLNHFEWGSIARGGPAFLVLDVLFCGHHLLCGHLFAQNPASIPTPRRTASAFIS